MKKLLIYTLLLTSMTYNANAQQVLDKLNPNNTGALYRNNVLSNNELLKTEGSVYFVNEFRAAEVSGVPQQLLIRYNAFTDMIEVKNEKGELFSLVKKTPYNTITILHYNEKIKLLDYKSSGDLVVNGYLVELFSNNDVTLYRRDKTILQKGKAAVNSYASPTASRYIKKDAEYYISVNNEIAIAMPKNKKELLALFPSNKEEIAAFVKKNDYSLKEERSIIEIAKFISNL
ncbi:MULTISPECIES: hypothetical protein [unclassified Flavobacterium]|uniref:hypothetical protein n=1 Tax=unclassified Flavobacterium TaxID=196869 RepID=UPI003F8F3D59